MVYAVELDRTRSREAAALLEGATVLYSDFNSVSVSPHSRFGFIWCNPPYDFELGGGVRVEGQFLRRCTDLLAPGGVMCLACPADVMTRSDICDTLLGRYRQIAWMPYLAAHRQYKEVVIFGVKREKAEASWLRKWSTEASDSPGLYAIPATPGPTTFRKSMLTDEEAWEMVDRSPLNQHLQPQVDRGIARPPMSLGKGHRALLLTAGHLDGIVSPPDEPPHVVRGTAKKITYLVSRDEEEKEDGAVQTTQVYSEKISLVVRALDHLGNIMTFQDEADEQSSEENDHEQGSDSEE
jgi:hypothetical protein